MRRGGFTLIELVMVIVILGILAAVALPTFFNLQDQARESACRGALGGIRSGIAIWYAKEAAASGVSTYPTIGQLTTNVMQGTFPNNPYANTNRVSATMADISNPAYGWVYIATSGQVWATLAGSTY